VEDPSRNRYDDKLQHECDISDSERSDDESTGHHVEETPSSLSSTPMGLELMEESPTIQSPKSPFQIVVTTPLSPKHKLTASINYQNDDHPYSLDKQRHKVLIDGYLRSEDPHNSLGLTHLPFISGTIFRFYYFHYADVQTQRSILDDAAKAKRCLKWLTSPDNDSKDFTSFLAVAVSTHLGDKIWNKMDMELRGVVETHELASFLLLPVVLYKSTLALEKEKKSKPKFKKRVIKSDLEHLATWIITTFGEEQADHSFHFVLTKEMFCSSLTQYVERYMRAFQHLLLDI